MTKILNRIPLNGLRYFESAARLLSFREAAEELGVTPAAVSLQIRRLEQRIERPLFTRSGRSLVLSETGERLAPGLTELFANLEGLFGDVLATEQQTLRVSAMPSFAGHWLAPRLARFAHQNARYNVRVEGDDRLITFDRDDVDVAIRFGTGDYPKLFCERIAEARAFPVCSPDYAREHRDAVASPAALQSAVLLWDEIGLPDDGVPSWPSWFAAAGVDFQDRGGGLRFASLHMALTAAMAGQGVALGLAPIVDHDLAAGRLVRLFDVEAPSSYAFWLVCRPERAGERKIAAFRRWILAEMNAPAD